MANIKEGAIMPLLLVGGIMVYYSRNRTEMERLKRELEDLKKIQASPTSNQESSPILLKPTAEIELDPKEQRREQRVLAAQKGVLLTKALERAPQMAKELKCDESLLKKQLESIFHESSSSQ